MERLTTAGRPWGLAKDSATNCSKICEQNAFCTHCPIQEAMEKLTAYEDAEEQGYLLKLPCKPGDIIYTARYNEINAFEVSIITIWNSSVHVQCGGTEFLLSDFGKTVFLTRKEAEAALSR